MIRYHCILSTLVMLLTLSACNFIRLAQDLDRVEQLAHIRGEVQASEAKGKLLVGVLHYLGDIPSLVNYKVLSGPGEFQFLLPPGEYQFFAFRDNNGDSKLQDDEPVARNEVVAFVAGENSRVQLAVPEKVDPEVLRNVQEMRKRTVAALPGFKKYLGKVMDLGDSAFDPEHAEMGMWEPLRFVNEVPFGILFLEPYSTKKTPVLFVHGIDGSPRNFEALIKHLDRRIYQPWVAYYPSGVRLENVAEFLDSALEELQLRYRISSVAVVAHSMGGLVSRALLLRDKKKGPSRQLFTRFISISTPWGGHAAAESGRDRAPVTMPVWNDMAPGSEFLSKIFKEKLHVPYYLLFGYQGGASLLQGNNDGVVSIASELRSEAQNEARLVKGFDRNHISILDDPEVSKLVNSLLAVPSEKGGSNLAHADNSAVKSQSRHAKISKSKRPSKKPTAPKRRVQLHTSGKKQGL